MPQENQHKPLRMFLFYCKQPLAFDSNKYIASIEDIEPHILKKYWKMRKNDKDILDLLLTKHIDTQVHGLG